MDTKIKFMYKGQMITARVTVDIYPGHNRYTVHSNKDSQIFVFRKYAEGWKQDYGRKFPGDVFAQVVAELERITPAG